MCVVNPSHSGAESAGPQPTHLLSWAGWIAGWAFMILWGASLLMFPLRKEMWLGYLPVAAGVLLAAVLWSRPVLRRVHQAVAAPSTRTFLAWIIVLSILLRLVALAVSPATLSSDSKYYHQHATRLASGQGYGETAYLPPGLPFLLAGWYALTTPSPWAARVLSGLFSVAAVVLVYDVGRRTLPPVAARWAALLMAVLPTLVFTSADVHTTSLLLLQTVATADLGLLALRRDRWGWLAAAGAGVVLASGTLVKPIMLAGPLFLFLMWVSMGTGRGAFARLVLCALVMVAGVLPWTIRNYRMFGELIPVSTNGGYVLYHGTNPESDGMWAPLGPPPPGGWGDDEITRDSTLRRVALERIRQDPVAFTKLLFWKQVFLWGTSSTNVGGRLNQGLPSTLRGPFSAAIKATVNAGWTALWLLCLAGTLRTRTWQLRALSPLVMFLLFTLALHLLFEVQSRYHIPCIGLLALVAGAGLADRSARLPARDTRQRAVASPRPSPLPAQT